MKNNKYILIIFVILLLLLPLAMASEGKSLIDRMSKFFNDLINKIRSTGKVVSHGSPSVGGGPGDSCTDDSDCSGLNLHCDFGLCCEQGQSCCLTHSECERLGQINGENGVGYYCDFANYYCVSQKQNGVTCIDNEECASINCQNSICCASGKTCCTDTSDCSGSICGPDNYCSEDKCQLINCALGYTCDSSTGECVQGNLNLLLNGEHCSSSFQCASNNCQNNACCSEGELCCISSSDCENEYICNEENYCVDSLGQSQQKVLDPMESTTPSCAPGCPDDWIGDDACDVECYNEECSYDKEDCATQYKTLHGQSCINNEQCVSNNCQNNICCPLGEICCKSDSNCPLGETCRISYCIESTNVAECSEGCKTRWLGDGICDLRKCYNEECNWDGGDCTKKRGSLKVYESPEEEGVSICNFENKYKNYGECLFSEIGKTETISDIEENQMISYCSLTRNLRDALTNQDQSNIEELKREISKVTEKLTKTLSDLPDSTPNSAKALNVLNCFSNSRRFPGKIIDYAIESVADSLYLEENIPSIAVIMHSPADMSIIHNDKKVGMEGGVLYEEISEATYKNFRKLNAKVIIVPNVNPKEVSYYSYGTRVGETSIITIEIDSEGNKKYKEFNNIQTSPNSIAKISNGLLEVDSDGDAVFETSDIAPTLIRTDTLNSFSIGKIKDQAILISLIVLIGFLFYYIFKKIRKISKTRKLTKEKS